MSNKQLNHFYVDVDDLLQQRLEKLTQYLENNVDAQHIQPIIDCFPSRELLNHLLLKNLKVI